MVVMTDSQEHKAMTDQKREQLILTTIGRQQHVIFFKRLEAKPEGWVSRSVDSLALHVSK